MVGRGRLGRTQGAITGSGHGRGVCGRQRWNLYSCRADRRQFGRGCVGSGRTAMVARHAPS